MHSRRGPLGPTNQPPQCLRGIVDRANYPLLLSNVLVLSANGTTCTNNLSKNTLPRTDLALNFSMPLLPKVGVSFKSDRAFLLSLRICQGFSYQPLFTTVGLIGRTWPETLSKSFVSPRSGQAFSREAIKCYNQLFVLTFIRAQDSFTLRIDRVAMPTCIQQTLLRNAYSFHVVFTIVLNTSKLMAANGNITAWR